MESMMRPQQIGAIQTWALAWSKHRGRSNVPKAQEVASAGLPAATGAAAAGPVTEAGPAAVPMAAMVLTTAAAVVVVKAGMGTAPLAKIAARGDDVYR